MSFPFRVERPDVVARRVAIVAQADGDTTPLAPPGDSPAKYLGRVLKLIPSEVVTLYLGIRGVVLTAAAGDPDAAAFLPWLPIIGLALVILVRSWGTRDNTGSWRSVQGRAVLFTAVSFVVWVMSLGHPIVWVSEHIGNKPWLSSIALMMWSFLIPLFYKGSDA